MTDDTKTELDPAELATLVYEFVRKNFPGERAEDVLEHHAYVLESVICLAYDYGQEVGERRARDPNGNDFVSPDNALARAALTTPNPTIVAYDSSDSTDES